MKNISSRKNLLKDAAILVVLALLLVALPWTQDLLRTADERAIVGGDTRLTQDQQESAVSSSDGASVEYEKAFIAQVLPKISTWDIDTVEPYLADATKSGDWNAEIGTVLTILSERLGRLERHEEPVLIPIADTPTNDRGEPLSEYELVAYYAKGVADISLVLAEGNDGTLLHSFNINVHDDVSAL